MLQKIKEILIMPANLALLPTLNSSNYPCLELIFDGPKGVRAIEVRLYCCGRHVDQGYSILKAPYKIYFLSAVGFEKILKIVAISITMLQGQWITRSLV